MNARSLSTVLDREDMPREESLLLEPIWKRLAFILQCACLQTIPRNMFRNGSMVIPMKTKKQQKSAEGLSLHAQAYPNKRRTLISVNDCASSLLLSPITRNWTTHPLLYQDPQEPLRYCFASALGQSTPPWLFGPRHPIREIGNIICFSEKNALYPLA